MKIGVWRLGIAGPGIEDRLLLATMPVQTSPVTQLEVANKQSMFDPTRRVARIRVRVEMQWLLTCRI